MIIKNCTRIFLTGAFSSPATASPMGQPHSPRADGVKAKTDVELSEAECRHVLSCLEPSRADEVAASTAWKQLQFDYRQLARALLVDHQRTASQYIRRNSVRGERRP